MAEKRRAAAGLSDSRPGGGCERDREFVDQAGVTALLTGAVLKLIESRAEDPVGFLAEHFTHLSEDGATGQQLVSRAVWSLSLAHHSHRSAFSSNVRVSYDLLARAGVRGRLYSDVLQCLCSEGGLSLRTSAPLLLRIQCREHERVPFELFRQGVLTCCVFADFIRGARCLYAAVGRAPDRPAPRALCEAVLRTLRDALETADGTHAGRFLEASAKISPAKVAQAMADAHPRRDTRTMDAQEFEDAAAALFIARVHTVS